MNIQSPSQNLTLLLTSRAATMRAASQPAKPAGASQSSNLAELHKAGSAAGSLRGGMLSRSAALRSLHSLGMGAQAAALPQNPVAQSAAPAATPAAPASAETAPQAGTVAPSEQNAPVLQPDGEEIIVAQTQQNPTLEGLFSAWGTDDAVHDLDGDGNVGVSDLLQMMQQLQDLLANWGQSDSPLGGEGETLGVPDLLAFLGQA